jgi:hypothetical protein
MNRAEKISATCEPTVYKMLEPRHLNSMGLHGFLQGQIYYSEVVL